MFKINSCEAKIYFYLTSSAVLWGIHAVAAKYIVSEMEPIAAVFIRFLFVSIILLLLSFYVEGIRKLPNLSQLYGMFILGLAGFFGNNAFYFIGIEQTAAVNAALIAASNPVITAVITNIFLKDKLNFWQWLGIIMSFCGVAFIVTKGSWQVIMSFKFNYGDILMFFAAASWSIYTIYARKVMKTISPLTATAWASVFGSILLGVFAVYRGFNGSIVLSAMGWSSMVYMIIGSGALAFYWWNKGVHYVGPNKAAIFTNIIPLSGVVSAAVLLKEYLLWFQFAGALLIFSGLWLTTHIDKKYEVKEGQSA